MTTIADFSADALEGGTVHLGDHLGQVVLVVNTASECGFTPQLGGLQELYERYADQGLVVLGFPCDQFGHQEPGDAEEISGVCRRSYGVTFPMFAKIEVNGADAHPLYRWLRQEKGGVLGSAIKWNFTKFLVGRDGRVISRHAPQVTPADLAPEVEAALGTAGE